MLTVTHDDFNQWPFNFKVMIEVVMLSLSILVLLVFLAMNFPVTFFWLIALLIGSWIGGVGYLAVNTHNIHAHEKTKKDRQTRTKRSIH